MVKVFDTDVVIYGNLHLVGVNKVVKTRHDALYIDAEGMRSNGAPADDGSTVAATPAWLLDTNERVKGRFFKIDEWNTADFRFEHYNPSGASGTVTYDFNYVLQYPLFGTLVNAAGTTVSIPAITLPTTNALKYETPSQMAGIATPGLDFFGNLVRPVVKWSLTKTGGTLATVGVASLTATRMT